MATQIDIDDPKHREAARQMLWRHENFEAEANVTSAVRDFLNYDGTGGERGDRGGEPAVRRVAQGG